MNVREKIVECKVRMFQVQDHIGDVQLRHEGHLLVSARRRPQPLQDQERRERPAQGPHLR